MRPHPSRKAIPWRRWIANAGLFVGMILFLLPLGMRVYGTWWEKQERSLFMVQAAAAPPAKAAPTEPSVQRAAKPAVDRAPKASHASVRKPKPKPKVRKAPAPRRQAIRPSRKKAPTLARPPQPWRKSLLQIPSIGVDAPVAPARGSWKWIKGPAYDPNSAGPGGSGNAVIAAHRNMWARTFARLPHVKPGDRIYVQTKDHRYTYLVEWSRKVGTREDHLLNSTKDPCITLYTCVLPFRADERWAVRGRLVAAQATAPRTNRLAGR